MYHAGSTVFDEIIYISTLQTSLVCVGVFYTRTSLLLHSLKGSGHRRRAEGFLPLRFRVDPVGVPRVCALPHSYPGRREGGDICRRSGGKWAEQLRALKELSLVRFRVDPLRKLLRTYTAAF